MPPFSYTSHLILSLSWRERSVNVLFYTCVGAQMWSICTVLVSGRHIGFISPRRTWARQWVIYH